MKQQYKQRRRNPGMSRNNRQDDGVDEDGNVQCATQ